MPELERPETERTAYKFGARSWSTADEAVAVAAICACESSAAYHLMIRPLMEAIGHAPFYGDKANPSPSKVAEDSLRAFELRVITKMLGAYDGWKPSELMGFQVRFCDPDTPLSWGIRVKILRPYFRRMTENKTRIEFPELCQMVGRDRNSVSHYLSKLRGPEFIDKEIPYARMPVSDLNKDQIASEVHSLSRYSSGNRDDYNEQLNCLRNIWKLMEQI